MSEVTQAIKGVIAKLPDSDRRRVSKCYGKLAALIAEYGDAGLLAVALIGSELSDSANEKGSA